VGQEHVVVGNRQTTRDSLVPLTVKIASLMSNGICWLWIMAAARSAEVSMNMFCGRRQRRHPAQRPSGRLAM